MDESPAAETLPCILNPWGDDSIVITVPPSEDKLIACLNTILLPERYSAIWHTKKNRLEIIFTAYPLTGATADVIGRSFNFKHEGVIYRCSYEDPSEELFLIANAMVPTGPANSSAYRNLGSFRAFMMSRKEDKPKRMRDLFETARPICFWIDGIEWDEDIVLELANHLNFYMVYYDTASPRINIHSPQSENITRQPQTRFAFDKFPTEISSIRIEDNLLHLWDAARIGDPARRFLYNYQIIEHAAFYHLEDSVSRKINKALSAPNALSNIDDISSHVIEILHESKL